MQLKEEKTETEKGMDGGINGHSGINEEKSRIRAYVRELRSSHSASELSEMSEGAVKALKSLIEESGAQTILLYASLPDEVNTHELLNELHAQGRLVLIPSVCGDSLELRVYDPSHTATGAFGIMESCGVLFDDFEAIDLAVIPGVAFTRDGQRLGRGKGYYDRLLPLLPCPKIGLCFPFQILSSIPTASHDASVQSVVSAQ